MKKLICKKAAEFTFAAKRLIHDVEGDYAKAQTELGEKVDKAASSPMEMDMDALQADINARYEDMKKKAAEELPKPPANPESSSDVYTAFVAKLDGLKSSLEASLKQAREEKKRLEEEAVQKAQATLAAVAEAAPMASFEPPAATEQLASVAPTESKPKEGPPPSLENVIATQLGITPATPGPIVWEGPVLPNVPVMEMATVFDEKAKDAQGKELHLELQSSIEFADKTKAANEWVGGLNLDGVEKYAKTTGSEDPDVIKDSIRGMLQALYIIKGPEAAKTEYENLMRNAEQGKTTINMEVIASEKEVEWFDSDKTRGYISALFMESLDALPESQVYKYRQYVDATLQEKQPFMQSYYEAHPDAYLDQLHTIVVHSLLTPDAWLAQQPEYKEKLKADDVARLENLQVDYEKFKASMSGNFTLKSFEGFVADQLPESTDYAAKYKAMHDELMGMGAGYYSGILKKHREWDGEIRTNFAAYLAPDSKAPKNLVSIARRLSDSYNVSDAAGLGKLKEKPESISELAQLGAELQKAFKPGTDLMYGKDSAAYGALKEALPFIQKGEIVPPAILAKAVPARAVGKGAAGGGEVAGGDKPAAAEKGKEEKAAGEIPAPEVPVAGGEAGAATQAEAGPVAGAAAPEAVTAEAEMSAADKKVVAGVLRDTYNAPRPVGGYSPTFAEDKINEGLAKLPKGSIPEGKRMRAHGFVIEMGTDEKGEPRAKIVQAETNVKLRFALPDAEEIEPRQKVAKKKTDTGSQPA